MAFPGHRPQQQGYPPQQPPQQLPQQYAPPSQYHQAQNPFLPQQQFQPEQPHSPAHYPPTQGPYLPQQPNPAQPQSNRNAPHYLPLQQHDPRPPINPSPHVRFQQPQIPQPPPHLNTPSNPSPPYATRQPTPGAPNPNPPPPRPTQPKPHRPKSFFQQLAPPSSLKELDEYNTNPISKLHVPLPSLPGPKVSYPDEGQFDPHIELDRFNIDAFYDLASKNPALFHAKTSSLMAQGWQFATDAQQRLWYSFGRDRACRMDPDFAKLMANNNKVNVQLMEENRER